MYLSVIIQMVVGGKLWCPPQSDTVVPTLASVFLVVRTYALYNGNKCILWVLVISAAAVLANGVVSPSQFWGANTRITLALSSAFRRT